MGNGDLLTILQGDALEKLRELPDESVQCCCTSPPFWGLRDYGTAKWDGGNEECDHRHPNERRLLPHGDGRKYDCYAEGRETSAGAGAMFKEICGKCGAKRIDAQIGLEKTPEEYVAKLVEVFREVRRVLQKDGTLWLNLGDSYCSIGHKKSNCGYGSTGLAGGIPQTHTRLREENNAASIGCKHKDLVGIPWMVAFALRADGWWLRSDIIWNKANCMPESVLDRPTRSHEYLFLLSKSGRYFYDAEAIKEPASESDWESRIGRANLNNKLLPTEEINGIRPRVKYTPNAKRPFFKDAREYDGKNSDKQRGHSRRHDGFNDRWDAMEKSEQCSGMRNKRNVWTIAPANYPEAHFATYPPDLIKPCILAGSSARGCCSECGAPWQRMVEKEREATRPGHFSATDHTAPHLQSRGSGGNTELCYRPETTSKTLGWQPTCKCNAGIQPCTVLDPFAGSGTTGMVAIELGRKAILIELNPDYVELIKQRCNVTPGLALA